MEIEDQNRIEILSEIRQRFPDYDVSDEVEERSETLNVYVNGRNGRVCTLSFTDREWMRYHADHSRVRAKIERAASSTGREL